MRSRLDKLHPQAVGPMPIMIGGSGPKVSLKLTAGSPTRGMPSARPSTSPRRTRFSTTGASSVAIRGVERTVAIAGDDVDGIERYVEVGAEHIIVMTGDPFDLGPLQSLIEQRDLLG